MQPSLPIDRDSAKGRQMARVRSKNTEPEIVVRRALHARGFRFRLHRKDLPGKPDIVLPKHGLAILVHGCFWHGCPRCDRGLRQPKTNAAFWTAKLTANKERDIRSIAALKALGWRVAVLWECDVRTPGRLDSLLEMCLPPGVMAEAGPVQPRPGLSKPPAVAGGRRLGSGGDRNTARHGCS